MEIHIGNRVADVTLVSKEGNKVRLSIDGKPYDVDIVMTENGSCSVLHDGNSFNADSKLHNRKCHHITKHQSNKCRKDVRLGNTRNFIPKSNN